MSSDSEEETRVKTKAQSKADNLDDDDQPEDEAGEEEYEIEEVLDAKRGYFPDGHMGYLVKWKGYGPEDNSWVDEVDATNAADLVEEFWRKNPTRKRPSTKGRKSTDKSPAKPRKSITVEESSDVGEAKSKKRGRKSASQKVNTEDEMDVDETLSRAPKKAKKNSTQASKKAGKARSSSPEEEVGEKVVGNMSRYLHLKDWEGLVESVDTVERAADNSLVVYFTLNTGESVKENSRLCKKRFPQKLLDFYETNLRWRSIDSDS